VVLHVDLDSFFVAVERRRRPDLAGRPLVIGGRPDARGMVAAASREARKRGIRVGMPLYQAAMRCPDGVFVDGAIDECFAAAQQIDELLRAESPDIEWPSVDEVFVALPASLAPRKAILTAERLHRAIGAMGFDAACGVAQSKLVARIASQLGKPRGVVHVLDGYEARFLSPLKIEVLPGIDPSLARRFRAAGVRRLGQLAKLSEVDLLSLAGRSGAVLARQAAGVDQTHVRRTALPPPRLQDSVFPDPISDPAQVHGAIRTEVERIGRELRSRGVYARTLTLRVRFADGRRQSATTTLTSPSALDDVLMAAALEVLARLWPGDRPIRAVGVSCAGLLAAASDATLFPLRHA
jgi:DNA polymerase-4